MKPRINEMALQIQLAKKTAELTAEVQSMSMRFLREEVAQRELDEARKAAEEERV